MDPDTGSDTGLDPDSDPAIFVFDLQRDANKKKLVKKVFLLISF
jgi:hypothetical protein